MEKYNALAVTSFICGILCWVVLGIVLAPASIVTGIIGLKTKDSTCKVLAILGIISGAIGLAVLLFSIMLASAIARSF